MATKIMHRVLDLNTGNIYITDFVWGESTISLNEIHIGYDDQLEEKHRDMVVNAIDKKLEKMNAEIYMMQEKRKQFLAIESKTAPNTWEEVEDGN